MRKITITSIHQNYLVSTLRCKIKTPPTRTSLVMTIMIDIAMTNNNNNNNNKRVARRDNNTDYIMGIALCHCKAHNLYTCTPHQIWELDASNNNDNAT